MTDDPKPPPSEGRTLAIAVVTALCTAFVSGLAAWAVDELKQRYGTRPPQEQSKEDA